MAATATVLIYRDLEANPIDDQTVAASRHADTPQQQGFPGTAAQPRLKIKLKYAMETGAVPEVCCDVERSRPSDAGCADERWTLDPVIAQLGRPAAAASAAAGSG
jgi:hypothetical protein